MKNTIKLALNLVVWSVIACCALALVNSFTAPIIQERTESTIRATLVEIFPEVKSYDDVLDKLSTESKTVTFDNAYLVKSDNETLGIAITATGPTYNYSTIMVGLNLDSSIKTIKFISNNDTKGIGTRVLDPSFTEQFNGKIASDPFKVAGDVDGVSGATVSSKGVANILKTVAKNKNDTSLMLGLNMKGAISGLRLIQSSDANVEKALADSSFVNQFIGKSVSDKLLAGQNIKSSIDLRSLEAITNLVQVACLSGNEYLKNKRLASLKETAEKDLAKIFPNAKLELLKEELKTENADISIDFAYVVKSNNKTEGIAVIASGPTYKRSTIMTIVKPDANIATIRCITSDDTEGIGTRVQDETFTKQFEGKATSDGFKLGVDIDEVSGATLSASGFVNIVKVSATAGLAYLKK